MLCDVCRSDSSTLSGLFARVQKTEAQLKDVHLVCGSCCGTAPAELVQCESLDCPWMYERKKLESKAEAATTIQELIEDMEDEWYQEKDGYLVEVESDSDSGDTVVA